MSGQLLYPWKFLGPCVYDWDGSRVLELEEDVSQETARRIVACFNVCEGLSTETLESMPGQFFRPPYERLKQVEEQRDDLLAAAGKLCEVGVIKDGVFAHAETASAVRDILSAIAKAKGGAA